MLPWLLPVLSLLLALAGTPAVLGYLRRRQILDQPNERSSHKIPTPRGGGLAVIPAILLPSGILLVLESTWPGEWTWPWLGSVLIGAAVLMAWSWIDDRRGLPVAPRFLVQAGVVITLLLLLPNDVLIFRILPWGADRLIAALGWLWFVNLYNFMDGIDGMTGVETVSLGTGLCVVSLLTAATVPLGVLGLIPAAAALGFLVWNWHPARLFMGDVGSIPLGLLLGGLLIQLALAGGLAAAVILPGYYLADATLTLLRRVGRREKFWQAHRQHFYQRAVHAGERHDPVALLILGGNLLLIGAAMVSVGQPWGGLALGMGVVAGMLMVLRRWGREIAP